MNYYITGANGFIGSHLSQFLTKQGKNVLHIFRDGENYDLKMIKRLFNKYEPNVIFHLGAYGNHSFQSNFEQTVSTNLLFTKSLLDLAQIFNCQKFYNFSSSSVTLEKQTYYSITKLASEGLANMYDFAVNIRPYSVYGVGEAKHRFIPTVIRCLKSGEQMNLDLFATHDWIYIDDFIRMLLSGKREVGSGIKTSNIEIVNMLEQISGEKLLYSPQKMRYYDNDNWVCPTINKCEVSLYDGLKRVYESAR